MNIQISNKYDLLVALQAC